MKNAILLILFVFPISLSAQTEEKEIAINIENISKKWVFLDVINPGKPTEELDEMKSMLEGTYIEFKSDLSYTFSFVLDLEGSWELKENIISTKDRKGSNKWVIHSLEEKKLIASRNKSTQKIIFQVINTP